MRILGLISITVFFSVTSVCVETIPSVRVSATKDQGAAVAKTREGKPRWKNSWTMEKTSLDGRPVIHFKESGEGVHSPFTQEVRWTILSWWSDNGSLLPLRSESTYTDLVGTSLSQETHIFDWPRKQVRIEQRDLTKKKTTTRTLDIPSDTLGVDGIARILQDLDFSRTTPFNAHLLSNEPKVYDISLEVRGKERIQTKDGMADCYKLELVPHLGILSPLRVFYPKAYFWFRLDSPHNWVRYEGLENGPGSPEIVMEMR